MLLENQSNRTSQPWLGLGIRRQNPGDRPGEGSPPDRFVYDRTDSIPGSRYFSHHHQNIRRQPGDEHGNAGSQMIPHMVQCLGGFRITLLRQS